MPRFEVTHALPHTRQPPLKIHIETQPTRQHQFQMEMPTRTPTDDPWSDTLKRLGPAGKIRASERLYFTARRLKEAAIRAKHPTLTDPEVRKALNEAFWYARD